MNGKRRVGLLITSLLCITGLSAASASSALGDTNNADGSHTATTTIPAIIHCPTSFGGTVTISPGLVLFIPATATVVSHVLTVSPACSGATLSENFMVNASDPPPQPNDQTIRDDPTLTCNQGGGCPAGTVGMELDVTYTDLFGAPDPQALTIPKKIVVPKNIAKLEAEFFEREGAAPVDIGDGILFYFAGALPKPHSAAAALTSKSRKRIKVATLPDTHLSPGQTVGIPVALNARGRRLLRQAGKLSTTLVATLRNSAGTATLTGKLKLVLKQ